MKKLTMFLSLLLIVVMSMAQGMQIPEVPMDPDVKKGKLDNGLTYYVRKNAYPEKRVNFYIAQKVGSIQEEESQRGLAHFLEHMCFNGTEHFPDNQVIRYCETLGVNFGRDLNAYTSIDQTVYRICNVPSTRQSALDSCLLIIKDWSNGLLLQGSEIDKERGVIHEEWRLRTDANSRMLERNLEKLYPGSKYGKRYPIGLMSVIDNFKYDELREYYKKWYRPDNQAVIVIGDVDVDYTINKIKEMFGGNVMPENPAPVVEEQVPDNAKPIVIIDKDKEFPYNIIQASFKHEAMPTSQNNTMLALVEDYVKYVVNFMLNARIQEKALEPDCPFLQAGAEDSEYLFSKTKDAFTISVLPKTGMYSEALGAVYREALRAAKFGFTATEYSRAQSEYKSIIEKQFLNRDKRESDSWGDDCRDNFLDNAALPSMETMYMFSQQAVPSLPVDMINQGIKDLISLSDSNLVIISFNTEKEGAVYPTEEGFLTALNKVRGEQLTAYVDNVRDEPLMTQMPKAGKIKKESDSKFGYKKLELSNGATVYLKKTDFKADQVLFKGYAKGGSSMLTEKDYPNIKCFSDVMGTTGLGNFDNTELSKALAGKQVSMSVSMSENNTNVSGSSTPKDLETMFQLLYLNFTNTKKDQKAFDNALLANKTALKELALNPQVAFSDSLKAMLYDHNPRYARVQLEDLDLVSLDRCLEIKKQITANAANFSFVITGNYDETTIRPLIEQYVASLPSKNKVDATWKNVTTFNKGKKVNHFTRKMETPTAICYIYRVNKTAPVGIEEQVLNDAAGQVLNMVYLKTIREEASAAYSAGAGSQCGKTYDGQVTLMMGACPFKYEKEDSVLLLMHQGFENLGEKIDPDQFQKVKEVMLKDYEDGLKKNSYWSSSMADFILYGQDNVTDYQKTVQAMTPEKVAAYVKKYILTSETDIEVVMMPEL